MFYNIPHQSWSFHPILPKHTLFGIWVRLVIFESVWWICESVLIEKLGVIVSWFWCLVHQNQHLGGNNSLIVHFCLHGWDQIFHYPRLMIQSWVLRILLFDCVGPPYSKGLDCQSSKISSSKWKHIVVENTTAGSMKSVWNRFLMLSATIPICWNLSSFWRNWPALTLDSGAIGVLWCPWRCWPAMEKIDEVAWPMQWC